MPNMTNHDKIYFSLKHVSNKSVVSMSREDWTKLVRDDGGVTELEGLPREVNNAGLRASLLVVVASGIENHDPGIDIFRHDPSDKPFVVNMDHYTVIENLQEHDVYSDVLRIAGVDDCPEIRSELKDKVYIVKDPPIENRHWFKDFPEFVLNAKKKASE